MPAPAVQVSLWWALMLAAALAWIIVGTPVALIILLTMQFIPFWVRMQPRAVDTKDAKPRS